MAGETNPTGPSPMTDTDAGKRLSDALRPFLNRAEDFKHSRKGDEFTVSVRLGDLRKLRETQTHIAAITANRGSVSEERAREIKRRLHDIANGITLRECADSDAHFLHDLADNLPAIQQAVSECSGGGAEEMREADNG